MGTAGEPNLLPLGTLAPRPGESWSGEELDLALVMPEGLRVKVVDYLSRCPVYLAWMEYTRDVIGDRFGVSGGSAIASDGTFYWRLDGVEYIREYGIAVPEAAIRHMESRSWIPPEVGRDRYLETYEKLMEMIGYLGSSEFTRRTLDPLPGESQKELVAKLGRPTPPWHQEVLRRELVEEWE